MPARYAPEFVATLVAEVHQGQRSLSQIARTHGLHPGVLSKWVRRSTADQQPSPAEPESVASLSARVAQLEDRIETLRAVLEKSYCRLYQIQEEGTHAWHGSPNNPKTEKIKPR